MPPADVSSASSPPAPVTTVHPGDRIARVRAGVDYAVNALIALVLLVALAPVWIAVAIAIKLESSGPVLYRATRIGRGGHPFAMLKFRKMHDGARGSALTVDGDDRFTRIGAFLAHTKLDELPQLLNVLTGQMRIVGPRPEDPGFVDRHGELFAPVLGVTPGITGLCQIIYRNESSLFEGEDFEAWYAETLLPQKIMIDLAYVTCRGPGLDARILFWTIVALRRPVAAVIDHGARCIEFDLAPDPEESFVPPRYVSGRTFVEDEVEVAS